MSFCCLRDRLCKFVALKRRQIKLHFNKKFDQNFSNYTNSQFDDMNRHLINLKKLLMIDSKLSFSSSVFFSFPLFCLRWTEQNAIDSFEPQLFANKIYSALNPFKLCPQVCLVRSCFLLLCWKNKLISGSVFIEQHLT